MVTRFARGSSLNALVAGREERLRAQIAEVLAEMGLSTVEASYCEETVEIVSRRPIHVMVLDADLPSFGGLETVRVIRTFCRVPPFLLMASEVTRELQTAALDGAATAVLDVPVDKSLLSDIVETVIMRSYGREIM